MWEFVPFSHIESNKDSPWHVKSTTEVDVILMPFRYPVWCKMSPVPEKHHYYLSTGVISWNKKTLTWRNKQKTQIKWANGAFSIIPAISRNDQPVLMHTGDDKCLLILNLVISRSAVERTNRRRKIQFVLICCWPTPKGCLWTHHFASERE